MPRTPPRPPRSVDQTPQHRKQRGNPVDLIENDQLVPMAGKVVGGLRQLRKIGRILEVEIQGPRSLRDCMRQRGLPHLPRAKQRNRWKLTKQILRLLLKGSHNHPCNHGLQFHDCKDNFG